MRFTKAVVAALLTIGTLGIAKVSEAQWVNDTTAFNATKIAVAGDGSVWTVFRWYLSTAGSNGATGVQRLKDGVWTRYSKSNGLANDSVRDLTIDRSGNVWVAGKQGISKFDGVEWSNYTIMDTATNRREFLAIACDSSGALWVTSLISTFMGILHGNVQMNQQPAIHRFEGSGWTTYWPKDEFELPPAEIPFIECDRFGNVYAFGYQGAVPPSYGYGFYHYNGIEWKTLSEGGHSSASRAKQPTGLACAPDGSVWLTFVFADDNKLTPGNIHAFNAGVWTGYDTSTGTPKGAPQALGVDMLGRKWLGYHTATGSGVWILDKKVVRQYTESDNPILRHGVSSISFAGSDAYLATPHGLAVLKDGLAPIC